MWIKICGMRNEAEARAAVEAGADAVGFLVGLDYPSDDALTLDAARRLAGALAGSGVERVLVTHRVELEWVVAALAGGCFDRVQLHGEFPLEAIPLLRRAVPAVRTSRVVHVEGEEAVARAVAVARVAEVVHLDTRTAERVGGTGRTHDWRISARIVAAVAPRPVVLAGGLNPGNVASAIALVRPWGIDANTGAKNQVGTFIESARRQAGGNR